MGDIAIRAEELGKQYHIGGPQKAYDRFGDQVVDMFMTLFCRTGNYCLDRQAGLLN